MPGRPIPTALKVIRGNPGKRRLNANEPKPRVGELICPDWFPETARSEWQRVMPELVRIGVLTSIDAAVFEGYCLSYARVMDAYKAGQKVEAAHLGQWRGFMTELGLTPAARARMSVADAPHDEKEKRYFGAA